MKHNTIKLYTSDFARAESWAASRSCPLRIAFNDMYPEEKIDIFADHITFRDKEYTIEGSGYEGGGKWMAYSGLSEDDVNALIAKAKEGEEIETVTVTLIPVE